MSDSENIMSDCLVFKLEEVETVSNEIDTTLYVLYDKLKHVYVVRGRRRWTPKCQSCTYSFDCDSSRDLADFIQYIICPENRVNEILYNYDNLPEDSNDITYEFLHDYDHGDYEISGYNDRKLKRKRLIMNLRMLKNVYNYY